MLLNLQYASDYSHPQIHDILLPVSLYAFTGYLLV